MKRTIGLISIIIIGIGVLGGWLYLINQPVEAFTTSTRYPSTQYPEDGDTSWGAVFEAFLDALDSAIAINAAPSAVFTDTTAGHDDYQIQVNTDILTVGNMDVGGTTLTETWEFQGDGDFVINDGGIVVITASPIYQWRDETAGHDDYRIEANADVLTVKNLDAGGATVQETWEFQGDGNFVVNDGIITVSDGATASGSINLLEDSDNGTNFIKLDVADTLGSDTTVTLPNETFTVVSPSYGSIFASSVTVTINTVNTDTLATSGWTANESNGLSYSSTTGIFTIGSDGAGTYEAFFGVSVSGQANAEVHYHLFHNGSGDPALQVHRKLSGGDVGSVPFSNLLTVAVGDTIKVMTQQDTGTTDQTLEHGSFFLKRIEH